MFAGSLGSLLPLAIGIAISPIPIIACILMLFSARARANGPAFLIGWVAGITLVTLLVFRLSDATGATDEASGPSLGDIVILLLGLGAIALGVRQWKGRPKPGEEAAMPTWMQAIDGFTPRQGARASASCSRRSTRRTSGSPSPPAWSSTRRPRPAATRSPWRSCSSSSPACRSPCRSSTCWSAARARSTRSTAGRPWLGANNAAVMAVLFIVIGAKLVGSGLDGLLS